MVCWIANDNRLFRANCFPTDRVISNWNKCSHIQIYLLHWNMDQKTEIRSYIKCRIRLNIDSKQIFNELCGIYGPQTISMRTVFRWVKAFKAGKFSVEDDTHPGRPKTSVTKANIAAVKIVVEQDARLSVKDIAFYLFFFIFFFHIYSFKDIHKHICDNFCFYKVHLNIII